MLERRRCCRFVPMSLNMRPSPPLPSLPLCRRRAVAFAAALGLAACAGQPAQAPALPPTIVATPAVAVPAAAPLWSERYGVPVGDIALRVGGSTPLEGAAPLLNSGVSFAGLDQRLQYSAGYQVDPGDLLNPNTASQWRADALPQSVSSQTINQQLKLKLVDAMAGAPVYVGAQYQQQESLRVNGSSESAQQAMDVNWAPGFAAVHLNWMPEGAPIDTLQALQCDRSGQVSVPLATLLGDSTGGRYVALDARARACRVSGDDPALALLTANTWSTGLRWGRATRETALRLQSVTPGVNTGVIASDRPLTAGSGYELRLSQQRALGDWQAKAGVAYRRPPEAERSLASEAESAHSPWATSAELRRQLAAMSIAASWQRGDAYWFLPDIRQQADTFALSVNFAPWSTALLGSYTPTMAMSYNWVRADSGNTRDDDQAVNWNVSFPWR
jgi:hypothetical protein